MLLDSEFRKYLEELIEYTSINRDELFQNCLSINKKRIISAEDLLQISNNLKVDPILLWQKRLDLNVLKSEIMGQRIMPACYSEVRGSSIASMNNLLERLKFYGIYDYALKKIQFNEKMITENTSISVVAINDLLLYSNQFLVEKDYSIIGRNNGRYLYETVLKNEINSNNTPRNITTDMVERVFHFEKNWNYKIIKSKLNSVIIESWESDLMRSTKTYRPFTNVMTNLLRFEFVKGVLGDLGVKVDSVVPLTGWDNPKNSFQFEINFH